MNLNTIDYPYYKYIVSAKEIRQDFSELKTIKLKKIPSSNLILLDVNYDKYFQINSIISFRFNIYRMDKHHSYHNYVC